jgi:carbon monoxide dehydrogenase subunit G
MPSFVPHPAHLYAVFFRDFACLSPFVTYAPAVDVEGNAELSFPVAQVYAELRDLDGYATWLSIVRRVERISEQPAWLVELSAGVGPIRHSKKVRMIRVEDESPSRLRFQRDETDGKQHSPWILTADLCSLDGGSTHLTMHLHYGGLDWLPLAGMALREEMRRAGPRLARRLAITAR